MKLTQQQINAGKRYDASTNADQRLTRITYLATVALIPILFLIAYLQR